MSASKKLPALHRMNASVDYSGFEQSSRIMGA